MLSVEGKLFLKGWRPPKRVLVNAAKLRTGGGRAWSPANLHQLPVHRQHALLAMDWQLVQIRWRPRTATTRAQFAQRSPVTLR